MDTTILRQENRQLKSSIREPAFLNDLSLAIGASFDSEEIMQAIIRKSIRAPISSTSRVGFPIPSST